jgi:hypothetical protein
VRDALRRLLPSLGGYTYPEIVHWTEADLLGYVNEALARLARITGVFVVRDTTTVIEDGQATYNLPAGHLSTIHAALVGGPALRPTRVGELESLDPLWPTTECEDSETPTRYAQDFEGAEKVRLYKIPNVAGFLDLVFHSTPAQVTVGSPLLDAPTFVEDYLAMAVLAAARGKEGDGAIPEVAKHAAERVALYERIFQEYFGVAQ